MRITCLQRPDEAVKRLDSFLVTFIHSGVLEHLAEYHADFPAQDVLNVLRLKFRVAGQKFLHPVGVFFNLFVRADVLPFQDVFLQKLQLAF